MVWQFVENRNEVEKESTKPPNRETTRCSTQRDTQIEGKPYLPTKTDRGRRTTVTYPVLRRTIEEDECIIPMSCLMRSKTRADIR